MSTIRRQGTLILSTSPLSLLLVAHDPATWQVSMLNSCSLGVMDGQPQMTILPTDVLCQSKTVPLSSPSLS